MKRTKHLLLWERMGDYHRARWRALDRRIGAANSFAADLGSEDGLYQWHRTERDPRHEVLVRKPVDQIGTWEAFLAFRRLVKERGVTHVAIPGYGRPAYLLMLAWSRLTGREVLMFAESWYPGKPWQDRLKGGFLRACVSRCLVSGERAREHFAERLGFPENRLETGYSTVDNEHFATKAAEADDSRARQPRELLCVARFAPEKNLAMLLRAFRRSRLAATWRLTLVGGGPQKEELNALAEKSPVTLRDWLSYDELPALYRGADAFILPSRFEPWGLVANEAMAAGLPVLLSDAVGAAPDLLDEGKNGWGFPHDDEDALVACLDRLADSPAEGLRAMGARSREIIRDFSPDQWAAKVAPPASGGGLTEAAAKPLGRPLADCE